MLGLKAISIAHIQGIYSLIKKLNQENYHIQKSYCAVQFDLAPHVAGIVIVNITNYIWIRINYEDSVLYNFT